MMRYRPAANPVANPATNQILAHGQGAQPGTCTPAASGMDLAYRDGHDVGDKQGNSA